LVPIVIVAAPASVGANASGRATRPAGQAPKAPAPASAVADR
jgi:hypothetical protein